VGCPSSITLGFAGLFGEIPKPAPRDVSEFTARGDTAGTRWLGFRRDLPRQR
jgi:hypothetical protein